LHPRSFASPMFGTDRTFSMSAAGQASSSALVSCGASFKVTGIDRVQTYVSFAREAVSTRRAQFEGRRRVNSIRRRCIRRGAEPSRAAGLQRPQANGPRDDESYPARRRRRDMSMGLSRRPANALTVLASSRSGGTRCRVQSAGPNSASKVCST
jgi:hypothetical protein